LERRFLNYGLILGDDKQAIEYEKIFLVSCSISKICYPQTLSLIAVVIDYREMSSYGRRSSLTEKRTSVEGKAPYWSIP